MFETIKRNDRPRVKQTAITRNTHNAIDIMGRPSNGTFNCITGEVNLNEKGISNFWRKVNKNGPFPDKTIEAYKDLVEPCWIWTASEHGGGYGGFGIGSKVFLTHVISWIIHNGQKPVGMCVLHRCDNRPCVNPEHLFLGTRITNNLDCLTKGRIVYGEKNGRAKLTAELVRQARTEYSFGNISFIELGKKYGVNAMTIRPAILGRTWGHIKPA